MKLELTWANCFWLMISILAWNIIFGPKLTDPRITSDANSSAWLLGAENVFRMVIFILPLFMSLPRSADCQSALPQFGFAIYVVGTLIYFVSWLPLIYVPTSTWSNSPLGLLAPALTPFLFFLGIALLGHSWLYGVLSVIFICIHTLHGIQNF